MTWAFDEAISVPWLVFDVTGQWCLLALLVTFYWAKHLPQRKNPFLINFILTSFLASIPPALLLYAGQMHEKASKGLCHAQAALVEGFATSFGVAYAVLVFDTWCELRSTSLHKPYFSRGPLTKYLLLFAPYASMCIWSLLSFVVAARSQSPSYDGFAYCVRSSQPSQSVSNAIGYFMSIVGLIGLFFELWVCWMIYSYPTKAQKDPLIWRTNIQFAVRVVLYSSLLLITVLVSLINKVFKLNSPNVKAAYQLLNSMSALAAFIVFGTQKSILQVWKFWGRKRSPDDLNELEMQPKPYPVLDWADIPARQPLQFNGEGFESEEQGRFAPDYMRAWHGPR